MKKEIEEKILKEGPEVYDAISGHFNASRNRIWEYLFDLKKYALNGDSVLDAGCGNGRLASLFDGMKVKYTGIDNSEKLLEKARDHCTTSDVVQDVVQGDISDLPFEDESFDVIFCIAVLHHIPGRERRQKVLQEFRRVLKKGGILVMTNWFRYSLRREGELKYILKYGFLKLVGKNKMDFKDVMLPWAHSGKKRFYHCFTLGELNRLIKGSGFDKVESYHSKKRYPKEKGDNLVNVARKW